MRTCSIFFAGGGALLALAGCSAAPKKRPPAPAPSLPIYTPATRGDVPTAAPSAASITIIHIRPEARDYVQP